MKLTFNAQPMILEAAAGEENRRATITGLAVPWDVPAVVSSGERVMFARGAFDVNQKAAKLIENHDLTQLVGTVPVLVEMDEGLGYVAEFAGTSRAADAIELIKASAYDAVSVGADVVESHYDKTHNATVITAAHLIELSLVAYPAFQATTIETLAASQPETDNPDNPTTEPEKDTDTVNQENPVEVEAATIATEPIYAAARRAPKLPSPAEYVAAMRRGGAEFAQLNANIQAATGDVLVSDGAGLLPTQVVGPIFSDVNPLRPIVSALGPRALPDAGSSFVRPYVKVHSAAGEQTTELTSLSTANFEVDKITINKKTFGATLQLSEQIVDWSAPSILDAAISDMAGQYALATEDHVVDTMAAAMTNSNEVITDLTDGAAIVQQIYQAAAAIATVGNYLPNVMVVAPAVWAKIGNATDGAGNKLFPQVNTVTGMGTLPAGASGWNGNPLGLQLIVSNQVGTQAIGNKTAAEYIWLMNSRAVEVYETQKGFLQLTNPATLGIQISVRGYFAAAVIDADMVRILGPDATF